MKWLVVDESYLNYLREKEPRIPKSDYGNDKYKPFFGELFETEDFYYITQVSHPQMRHYKMKDNIDFKKIYDPRNPSRLIAVVNLNYMFPIPKNEKIELEYKDIDLHRTFSSETEKSKYINLMKRELKAINDMHLEKNAYKIYVEKYEKPESQISRRCIDFKNIEVIARTYTKEDNINEEK